MIIDHVQLMFDSVFSNFLFITRSESTESFHSRADPRQDPLLGPLLAELDEMSAQQQRLTQGQPPVVETTSAYRRNSVPYQPALTRPPVQSHSNHSKIHRRIFKKRRPSSFEFSLFTVCRMETIFVVRK